MNNTKKLVIMVTKGIDHGLSSVAFTVANGGITAGQQDNRSQYFSPIAGSIWSANAVQA